MSEGLSKIFGDGVVINCSLAFATRSELLLENMIWFLKFEKRTCEEIGEGYSALENARMDADIKRGERLLRLVKRRNERTMARVGSNGGGAV